MEIFLRINNLERGPYDLSRIQQGIDSGQIQPTDLAWYEGAPGWITIWQIPGIKIDDSQPVPQVAASASTWPEGVRATDSEPVEMSCLLVIGSMILVHFAMLFVLVLFLIVFSDVVHGQFLLTLILLLFTPLSLLWVYLDAKELDSERHDIKGFLKMAPGHWVLACFLAWNIAFPAYLLYRYLLKKANRARQAQ